MERKPGVAEQSHEVARGLEEQAVKRLREHLDTFLKFERPLRAILQRKYPPERLLEAEGKKCILAVSGLRYHNLVLYLEVYGLGIREVSPYDTYDTYIIVSLSRLNELLGRTLSGDRDAFGDILASGEGKVIGMKAPHDLLIFEEIFQELADHIAKFLPMIRG